MKTAPQKLIQACPLILLILFPLLAHAAPGDADLSFDPGSGVDGTIYSVAVQSDGKVIIGGDFATVKGLVRNRIARLNADGSGDSSFNPGTGANFTVNSVVVQSDGRILMGGQFSTVNGTNRNGIARLNVNGSLDSSFNPGTGANGNVYSITIQTNGLILIGGNFSTVNGTNRNGIARLNVDGSLDSSFNPISGPNCIFCSSKVSSIAMQADGKVIVGGGFTTVNGTNRNGIARLNANGSLDASFNPGTGTGGGGAFNYADVYSVAVQADGKVIIGGGFTSLNSTNRNKIARLNADGSLDPSFNPGTGANGYIYSVAVQINDTVLIGGRFTTVDGTSRNCIARLDANGTLDTSFNPGSGASGGSGSNYPEVRHIVVQADGKVFLGGNFTAVNGTNVNCIAQLNSNGSLDSGFDTGTGANSWVNSVAVQADGKVLIGGVFTMVKGVSRKRIARLSTDGSLDASFLPGTGADSDIFSVAIQSDGKSIIGGYFTSVNGTTRNNIARLNIDGSLDASFNPGTGANNIVRSVLVQTDDKVLIGGDFTRVNGINRGGIARLNANGSLDTDFNPGTGAGCLFCSYLVNSVAVDSGGKVLIGGGFTQVNGVNRNLVARLNSDGSLDTGFIPGALSLYVFAVAVQSNDRVLIGGNFARGIARLNLDGSGDTNFHPGLGANGTVNSLAVQADDKVLIGGVFTRVNGTNRNRIARLNADGSLDTLFDPGTGADRDVNSVGVSADGRVLIGGAFTSVNGEARWRVARLLGSSAVVWPTIQLPLGYSLTNHFGAAGDRAYFLVEVPPDGHLNISLDDLDNLGFNEIYVRRGAKPTAGTYDYRYSIQGGADQNIFVPNAGEGDWYIMVYGAAVPVPGNFTIRADYSTGPIFQTLQPTKVGNSASASLVIDGAGFNSSAQVFLMSGGTVMRTGVVSVASLSRLLADFNLIGVSSGTYDVKLVQGTNSVSFPIEIVSGGAPKLETQLIIPGSLGRATPATIFVEYANTGDGPMPAPLLVLRGSAQAKLSLDTTATALGLWSSAPPRGFSDTVQLLASGKTPGILQPGERFRVPIAYAGILDPATSVQFDLGVFDNSNISPVDWDSLKADLRPGSLTTNAWDVIWANFVANVGPSWGDYAAMLSDNALYLGKLGLTVNDVSELLAFELAQADSLNPVGALALGTDAAARQPGFNLVFGRVFPQSISQRLRFGPLGWGWSHNWSFNVSKDTNGNVTIQGPAGAQRLFQPDVRGGFFAQAGDFGKLAVLSPNVYELRETDGSRMVFRADGKLDFVEDLNANRITAAYSGALLTSLTHSSGQSLTLNYSGGLLQSVTDPFGRVTTYAYDGAQNLASATYYGTNTVSYAYSTGQGAAREHALTTVTYPGGTHEYFSYDSRGRLVSVNRDGGAEAVNFVYDTAGTVFVTDTFTNQSKLFFDQRGLLAKVENPLKNNARFSFDKNFNLTGLQGPDGKSSALTLDAKGNVTKVLDPAGNALAMSYTNNTRLGKLTDARGQVTGFNYDAKGNVIGMVYPNGSLESYTNDSRGEVIAVKNRRGQTITLTRDNFGRVTHKATPEGRTFDYDYDARGNLTNVVDSLLGTNRMTYDHRDLLASLTYHDGKGFTFEYDAAGRRTRRTSHDGYTLKYFYDVLGRLEHLEDGTGRQIIQYLYDPAGRLSRENKGNNTWTTYDYDAAGQVLHLVNYGTNGVPLSRFDYTYDANGNRTSMTTLAGTNSYTYDSIGQLTGVTYPNGRHVTYTYDAAGNRTVVNDNGTNTLYTVNNLNQYTQVGGSAYGFDADGNQTNKTEIAGTTSFEFDNENQLVKVVTRTNGTWQYIYDAFGNRISVTHNGQTNHFVHDPIGLSDLVAEFDTTGALIARYDHGFGLSSRSDSVGNTAYYNFDAVGNTHEITTANGAVANQYDYEPFGSPLAKQESIPNSFTYIGQLGVRNEASGLLFMRARSYSPDSGTFVSVDPVLFADSLANTYRYANGTPTLFSDPSGGGVYSGEDFSVDAQNVIGWSESLVTGNPVSFVQGLAIGYGIKVVASTALWGANLWKEFGPEATERKNAVRNWNTLQDLERIKAEVQKDSGYLIWIRQIAWANLDYAKAHDDPRFLQVPVEVRQYLDHPLSFPDEQTFATSVQNTGIVNASDPNELIGPAGYGPGNFLKGDGTFAYRVNFENASNATAPAQVVVVTNAIANNLDLAALEFTSVGFGDYFFAIPSGSQHYEHTESIEFNGTTFDVNIEISVDTATRQVRARFDSVMPESGLPPAVEVGFLPPENGTYRGKGHIAYVIRPNSGLPTGTAIRNIGTITFDPLAGGPTFRTDLVNPTDPNSGIDTNRQALVTIDTNLPISTVTGPSGTATNTSFVVTWSGSDVGAGVTSYDIFVQTNDGDWKQWLSFTTNASAIFGGYPNQTYGFYSIARDGAGNLEFPPLTADTTATTPTNGVPAIESVGNRSLVVGQQLVITNRAFDPDTPLTFTLVGPPDGASITTNGVFRWLPGCVQGSTTNHITVQVTDSANPPESSTMTFTITVSECVQVGIGSTVLQVGENGCVPVTLISTVGLTNLSFALVYPTGRFASLVLNATNPAINATTAQTLSGAESLIRVGTHPGLALQGPTAIGWICFDALPGMSAFVPLNAVGVAGIKSDGVPVGSTPGQPGRVVVIGREPLLEAWFSTNSTPALTLYGNPGTNYLLVYKTDLTTADWTVDRMVPLQSLQQTFVIDLVPTQLFYRAEEIPLDP